MAVQVAMPNVYIDEFTPGAPIEGVGTSTAAFIGPAARGPLNAPTRVTSFDRFLETFGRQPLQGFFLWYAVRGFFQNRGTECYVVRASNGRYDELLLTDRSAAANDLIRLRAREPGATAIQVAVTGKNLLPGASTSLYQPTATLAGIAGREVTLNAGEGAQFRPNDVVTIAAAGERLVVVRVTGDTLRVTSDPTGAYAAGDAVRLADATNAQTIRIEPAVAPTPGVLVPGAVLTITQGALSDSQIVESVETERLATAIPTTTFRVTFRQALDVPLSMDPANPASVQSEEFDVSISGRVYSDLSIDAAHPRYFVRAINGDSAGLVRVELVEPPPPTAPPENLPANLAATALAGGQAEDLGTLNDNDYIRGLDALLQVDDVNLVAVPGLTAAVVQQAVIAHCEQSGDRFAVLDSEAGLPLFGANNIEIQRQGLDSTRGYAALYYPWLRVPPVGAGAPILVPPSGHVCGIIARSDNLRGVHKAPANEIVNGAVDVERTMSNTDHGILNLRGINVIRRFRTGGRPMLWGARTTATDTNWQYVNIRRLFLFLEESIQEGIGWAVFEPNNTALWEKLRRTITDFLTRVWRDGGLFGETADKAFYVRIDEVLNPDSERALGRLHIEIGVRPSYPAEFIIVHIGIWYGGSAVAET